MTRILVQTAAIAAFIAVAAGAFAAHGLKQQLPPDMLQIFETGARYQMYHALALLAVAGCHHLAPSRFTRMAGLAFGFGIIVFSGSLYILALTGIRWLGAITPLGGLGFLSGWLCLLLAARQLPNNTALSAKP